MKNSPSYAVSSVDHALQLAVMLQVEGTLSVSDAASRLDVARSTAHRLLSMLVYRDFARQGEDRKYHAGPVMSLSAQAPSRTAVAGAGTATAVSGPLAELAAYLAGRRSTGLSARMPPQDGSPTEDAAMPTLPRWL